MPYTIQITTTYITTTYITTTHATVMKRILSAYKKLYANN